MNGLIKTIFALLTAVLTTSCLTANLPDIDTYEGCDIESVSGVYHRYFGTETIPAGGELQVKQHQLTVVNDSQEIDKEAGTLTFDVAIPTNLPESERGKVKASNLVVILNISTAALIEPIDGAPSLGVPGDWSKTNRYKVTAANGSVKEWSVTLHLAE